ncbi:FxsA family protein [Bacillus sp. WLY-B-L8]|uniref:FxsA family protein n=1 Tax=Bacillus multifaciens TaxID=3068506 RepID=UPI0027423545|nr:FxsA family protein [Bacillus sp. WLY-B-L8]MDP7977290.1 FxsA family protein [Bacillus sp. WLY-B-L8]
MKVFLFLFILIPALEITVLIGSSQWVGLWPTFCVIMLTSIIGAYIAKRQGLAVWRDIQFRLGRGEIPGDAVLDAICIFAGGILLMIPGYITDCVGMVLLIPVARKPVKYIIIKWMERKINRNNTIIVQK